MIEYHQRAIHRSEMQRSMQGAEANGLLVRLKCWKLSTGDIVVYDGWLVVGSHYRQGTWRLKNPLNNQIRLVRDCTIFEYFGKTIYW